MKILVFGSLNIDHDYHMDHIAKEKETIFAEEYSVVAGGKGLNASIALARSGVKVYLAGNIGNDAKVLEDVLEANRVDTSYLNHVDEPNGHAIIQIDKNGENSIFIYGGSNQSITTEYIDSVINEFEEGDFIILQNEINNEAYLIEKAAQHKLTVFMNPSPFNEKIFTYPLNLVDYFFINEVEGNALTGKKEPEEILDQLRVDYPETHFVLTVGANGSYYQYKDERIQQQAYKVEAIDTVGAGDTFMGYFIFGLSREYSVKECMELATKASAITVTRKGAADSIPTLHEISNYNF